MTTLLIIIYVSFISLGLPDALLGSAWPTMYEGLGVSIANAGIISMIISAGTIVSSLFSSKVIYRFKTGKTTFLSVLMTAVALLCFSFSNQFWILCLWAIPLGLGAGSVDAALNNFVALHYKAKHMNWLHCFWGVGATAGPGIMSYYLLRGNSWNMGYRAVGLIQMVLVAVLLVSLPLWRKAPGEDGVKEEEKSGGIGILAALRLKGVKQALLAFFCYCALESTVGLWGSTYLVLVRGISSEQAASWISLYYLGITLGRFLSGFVAMALTQKQMIRLGQGIIAAGILLFFLPIGGISLLVGLFLIGFGCAPIFPSLLHETPSNFGSKNSQVVMGMQMAGAYTGTTLMPPLFGFLGAAFGYGLFPFYITLALLVMIAMVNLLYKKANGGTREEKF